MMQLLSHARARRALLAIAAAASVTVLAVPASASSSISLSLSCGAFGNMVCTGAAQSAQVGTGTTEDVSVTCATQAEVAAENTVVSCYIVGVNDGIARGQMSLALVGTTSADTEVVGGVPVQGYELCVGGGYLTINGTFVAPGGYNCQFPLLA